MTKITQLSQADVKCIGESITRVEQKTSGEIFSVLAKSSDDYFYVMGFIAALWALLIGSLALVFCWFFWISVPLWVFGITQILGFVILFALCRLIPRLGMSLVPQRVKHMRAHANARQQFLAHGVHTTDARTGVLIFVSLAERYCEVIADNGIYQKVEHDVWDVMVETMIADIKADQLRDGFIHAIENAGEILAQHFPKLEGQQNELDDRLVIL